MKVYIPITQVRPQALIDEDLYGLLGNFPKEQEEGNTPGLEKGILSKQGVTWTPFNFLDDEIQVHLITPFGKDDVGHFIGAYPRVQTVPWLASPQLDDEIGSGLITTFGRDDDRNPDIYNWPAGVFNNSNKNQNDIPDFDFYPSITLENEIAYQINISVEVVSWLPYLAIDDEIQSTGHLGNLPIEGEEVWYSPLSAIPIQKSNLFLPVLPQAYAIGDTGSQLIAPISFDQEEPYYSELGSLPTRPFSYYFNYNTDDETGSLTSVSSEGETLVNDFLIPIPILWARWPYPSAIAISADAARDDINANLQQFPKEQEEPYYSALASIPYTRITWLNLFSTGDEIQSATVLSNLPVDELSVSHTPKSIYYSTSSFFTDNEILAPPGSFLQEQDPFAQPRTEDLLSGKNIASIYNRYDVDEEFPSRPTLEELFYSFIDFTQGPYIYKSLIGTIWDTEEASSTAQSSNDQGDFLIYNILPVANVYWRENSPSENLLRILRDEQLQFTIEFEDDTFTQLPPPYNPWVKPKADLDEHGMPIADFDQEEGEWVLSITVQSNPWITTKVFLDNHIFMYENLPDDEGNSAYSPPLERIYWFVDIPIGQNGNEEISEMGVFDDGIYATVNSKVYTPWLPIFTTDDEIRGAPGTLEDSADKLFLANFSYNWSAKNFPEDVETAALPFNIEEINPETYQRESIYWTAFTSLDEHGSSPLTNFFLEQEELYREINTRGDYESIPWAARPFLYDEFSTHLANILEDETGYFPTYINIFWLPRPVLHEELAIPTLSNFFIEDEGDYFRLSSASEFVFWYPFLVLDEAAPNVIIGSPPPTIMNDTYTSVSFLTGKSGG